MSREIYESLHKKPHSGLTLMVSAKSDNADEFSGLSVSNKVEFELCSNFSYGMMVHTITPGFLSAGGYSTEKIIPQELPITIEEFGQLRNNGNKITSSYEFY